MGRKRIILKSDDEPAMLALKDAARRESEMEIVLEEAPVSIGRGAGERPPSERDG